MREHSARLLIEKGGKDKSSKRDYGTLPSQALKQRYPAACIAIMYIKIDGQRLLENF